MAAKVEQTSVLNRARGAREHTATLDEVLLADRLVRSRLVHNRSLVSNVRRRDGRANAVVLVRLPLNDRLHNVVNVVVHNLANSLTLVNHAAVSSCLRECVLGVASNGAHKRGILVSVGMHLTNSGRGHHTAVDLLSKVLRLKHRLHVVLDVVLVNVVLTLAKKLLNLVTVVDVTRDRSKVLHVLVNVAGGHVNTRVDTRRLRHARATKGVRLRGRHALSLGADSIRLNRHALRDRSRVGHLRGSSALRGLSSGTLSVLVVVVVVGHKVRELLLGVSDKAFAAVNVVLNTVDGILRLVGLRLRLLSVENLLNDVAHLQFKVGKKQG